MFPDLIVGLGNPDDAAVYRLSGDRALVQTVDFFPPIVDDAYSFGAIAAANALSDVYAMGGEPIFALNICAFPEDLDAEIIGAILSGGADKVAEAGAAIAGGHSLRDREPKYGLVVTGMLSLPQLMSKGGASAGDILILTKPLGTGVITTALKRELAAETHVTAATESMLRLNRVAGRVARDCGVRAATDITGYGLLGHALEMASQAGVCFQFKYSSIPLLPGAQEYAAAWTFAGGAETNEAHGRAHVVFADGLLDWQRMLLFDPQTSGGLLVALQPEQVEHYLTQMQMSNEPSWVIGEVLAGAGIQVDL